MKSEDILEIIFFIIRELIKLTRSLKTECIKLPAQTIDVIAYYLLIGIFALDFYAFLQVFSYLITVYPK